MERETQDSVQHQQREVDRREPIVDPFWAIGAGLIVLFAVGAAALAAG
jgi:hypothetical protein